MRNKQKIRFGKVLYTHATKHKTSGEGRWYRVKEAYLHNDDLPLPGERFLNIANVQQITYLGSYAADGFFSIYAVDGLDREGGLAQSIFIAVLDEVEDDDN